MKTIPPSLAVQFALLISATLLLDSCQRPSVAAGVPASEAQASVPPVRVRKAAPRTRSHEVYAVWYAVPPHSLARRRAGLDELTAAHNHLPLGTLVRVTNIQNGKSVLVRITDRGITNTRAKIDVCKEAAQELGMISQGIARVRLEILPDVPQVSAPEPGRPASH